MYSSFIPNGFNTKILFSKSSPVGGIQCELSNKFNSRYACRTEFIKSSKTAGCDSITKPARFRSSGIKIVLAHSLLSLENLPSKSFCCKVFASINNTLSKPNSSMTCFSAPLFKCIPSKFLLIEFCIASLQYRFTVRDSLYSLSSLLLCAVSMLSVYIGISFNFSSLLYSIQTSFNTSFPQTSQPGGACLANSSTLGRSPISSIILSLVISGFLLCSSTGEIMS